MSCGCVGSECILVRVQDVSFIKKETLVSTCTIALNKLLRFVWKRFYKTLLAVNKSGMH